MFDIHKSCLDKECSKVHHNTKYHKWACWNYILLHAATFEAIYRGKNVSWLYLQWKYASISHHHDNQINIRIFGWIRFEWNSYTITAGIQSELSLSITGNLSSIHREITDEIIQRTISSIHRIIPDIIPIFVILDMAHNHICIRMRIVQWLMTDFTKISKVRWKAS